MLHDFGMCFEVLGCCNLTFCSEGVWGDMYYLLWVFLMFKLEIC